MVEKTEFSRSLDSPIAPLGLGRLSATADRHEWLLEPTDGGVIDRVETVLLIRDFIDQLPKTMGTFTKRHLVTYAGEQGFDEVTVNWFRPEFMWLADCWRLPAHYETGSRRTRWINPKYAHRDQYSPVTVQCECGGIVTKVKDSGTGYGIETEHTDDCFPGWQTKTAGILMENRRVFITRLGLLAKSARQNHDLFHCSKNQVSHYVDSCGADTRKLKRTGMNQRNNTFIELGRRGYRAEDIGRVYGLSGGRVREVISVDTNKTLSELQRGNQ